MELPKLFTLPKPEKNTMPRVASTYEKVLMRWCMPMRLLRVMMPAVDVAIGWAPSHRR